MVGFTKKDPFLCSITKDFLIGTFHSVAPKLLTTYTSLRSLKMITSLNPDNVETLFTQLNALPLLFTLSLTVEEWDSEFFNLFDFLWRPLAQLQSHSSLRHLTIKPFRSFSEVQYEIPPLPILRQLTSFTFALVDSGLQFSFNHKVIQALSKEQYGVHLTSGIGARIGLEIFSYPEKHTDPQFTIVLIEPVLLPFITYLEVNIGFQYNTESEDYLLALASLFRCLPQMCHLKKIKLKIRDKMTPTDYPSFLGALTSLTQLQKLFIELSNSSPAWLPTDMPVLPRVSHLSLIVSSSSHNWDVVKQFHLVHCFPELRLLQCRFDHYNCQERWVLKNPKNHICGQELARGVLELLPETIVKKIDFKFNGKFFFSSLGELIAESKRREQLEVSENKCAELKAENELLKKQLAQTDLALKESKTQTMSAEQKLKNFKEKFHILKTEKHLSHLSVANGE